MRLWIIPVIFIALVITLYFLNKKFHFFKVEVRRGSCPTFRSYRARSSEGEWL